MKPTVILLAGPAGSGKSTTAARIAEHPDWVHISEDDYWVRIKSRRPSGELRTREEQEHVQQQVITRLFEVLSSGKRVVLEFILYEDPPRPLLRYQQALAERDIGLITRILRPDVEEVLRRIQGRARANDYGRRRLRANAEHQVRVLASPHIPPEWVIDSTDLAVEEVYERYFERTVEQ